MTTVQVCNTTTNTAPQGDKKEEEGKSGKKTSILNRIGRGLTGRSSGSNETKQAEKEEAATKKKDQKEAARVAKKEKKAADRAAKKAVAAVAQKEGAVIVRNGKLFKRVKKKKTKGDDDEKLDKRTMASKLTAFLQKKHNDGPLTTKENTAAQKDLPTKQEKSSVLSSFLMKRKEKGRGKEDPTSKMLETGALPTKEEKRTFLNSFFGRKKQEKRQASAEKQEQPKEQAPVAADDKPKWKVIAAPNPKWIVTPYPDPPPQPQATSSAAKSVPQSPAPAAAPAVKSAPVVQDDPIPAWKRKLIERNRAKKKDQEEAKAGKQKEMQQLIAKGLAYTPPKAPAKADDDVEYEYVYEEVEVGDDGEYYIVEYIEEEIID